MPLDAKHAMHILSDVYSRPPHLVQSLALQALVLHVGFTFWSIVIAQSSAPRASLSTADRSNQTVFFNLQTSHMHKKQLPQEAISQHLSTPPTQTSTQKKSKWHA